ncbi:glycerol-3-phosphate 1-O-acyltransferase PlsY [Pyrinomonas methylaliphatogenes]|uniref:Glycerol-3-phosphate acyltransferase n=1 Tax=Pyrinomonas methylaliphatogenes TaxID=454194 RepID=A0A0B6X097_9BACT|nr:glycerol-3-phosphate 1-O-acyltransferase PlsY [Pyrinomonas methylaliphatogenes]CDM65969.1 acyl-phosphate glycerol 3-phosphate acyltransferase [Pyrinomonas methylaliphatogenes]
MKALLIIISYLLGSIPFGYLIVRHVSGDDVRRSGSGGTGATNVARRAGKGAGFLTLALDAAKGAAAVAVARSILSRGGEVDWGVAMASIAVVIGHIFPLWLGFRGGKGVATGLGVLLVLSPMAVLVLAPIFVIIVWLTRYVSLGSITAAVLLPFVIWLLNSETARPIPLLTAASIISAVVILRHWGNIVRLLRRTENKLIWR